MNSNMTRFTILIAIILSAIITPFVSAADETCVAGSCEDPSCPYRPHIIRCAAKYLDTNRNKKLERSELETAISELPWLAMGVLKKLRTVLRG